MVCWKVGLLKLKNFENVLFSNQCLFLEESHIEVTQYFCVFSELEDESTKVSAVELKHFIITGLKSLFGEVRARESTLAFSAVIFPHLHAL